MVTLSFIHPFKLSLLLQVWNCSQMTQGCSDPRGWAGCTLAVKSMQDLRLEASISTFRCSAVRERASGVRWDIGEHVSSYTALSLPSAVRALFFITVTVPLLGSDHFTASSIRTLPGAHSQAPSDIWSETITTT